MYKVVLGPMLALAALTANAKIDSGSDGAATKVNLSGSFDEQRAEILRDLDGGKVYAEITPKERGEVKDALARIASALQAPSGVEGLSDEEKTRVFNDQQVINSILTRAGADSRLICTREKKVGTHRPTTQCLTVAERRRMTEAGQDLMRQQKIQLRGNN